MTHAHNMVLTVYNGLNVTFFKKKKKISYNFTAKNSQLQFEKSCLIGWLESTWMCLKSLNTMFGNKYSLVWKDWLMVVSIVVKLTI